ncbi:MAG TPA: peptide-methionine (S)-S-oxide reductase MsrA [Rhizomicrobium sp.]|jgi:peptide-methionine (S)-S-oxide reductase|nr:peptide-methionine (S)-S-oxide reductase MsrA [Rhizomicrobium sp.]
MTFRTLPALFSAALLVCASCAAADEAGKPIPAPMADETKAHASGSETAVLSGGCFWGMQGLFEHVKGVRHVVAGYSGGGTATAQYETVSSGTTGNAESVKITFDPAVISYGQILRVFFSVAHDPTEVDRQGPDEGTQYRSDIFFANAEQEKVARAYIGQLERGRIFGAPIATRVDRLSGFYPAETYHQDYLIHHPDSPYIVFNDLPKIAGLKTTYPELYSEKPVTVAAAR